MENSSLTKNVFSVLISLSLAICLIFSSLSIYLINDSGSNDTSPEVSKSFILSNTLLYSKTIKNDILAELTDVEDNNSKTKKKANTFLVSFIRTLWEQACFEENNIVSTKDVTSSTIVINEPYYIEYCSLKIPLIS